MTPETDSRVQVLFDEIVRARDFESAHAIMQSYNGPLRPDLPQFFANLFADIAADDANRVAAAYRVTLTMFRIFTSITGESADRWKEIGLEIAEEALVLLPESPGQEAEIRLILEYGSLSARQENEAPSKEAIQRALRTYERARRVCTTDVNVNLRIEVWGTLAGLHKALYEIGLGNHSDEKSSPLSRSLPLDEHFYEDAVDIDSISDAYRIERQAADEHLSESIHYLEQCLAIVEGHGGRWLILRDLAENLAERQQPGDLDKASACYREALQLLDSDTPPDDYARIALRLGVLYRKHPEVFGEEPQVDLACRYLELAWQFSVNLSDEERWEISNDLGILYSRSPTGDPTVNQGRAVEFLKTAIELGEKANLRARLPISYINLGRIYESEHSSFEDALLSFEKADHLIEELRWQEGTKFGGLEETFHDLYRSLTRIYLSAHQPDKAFVAASRSRARYITEALGYRHGTPARDLPQTLWQEAVTARNAQAADEHEAASAKFAALVDDVVKRSPAGGHILRLEPVTSPDIARTLSANHALLVLYPTNIDVIAFVVRPSDMEPVLQTACISEKGLKALFHHVVVDWTVAYESYRSDAQPTPERLASIQAAMDQLIADVSGSLALDRIEPLLRDIEHVYVVAHSPLLFAPLHALRSNDRTLLDQYAISYLPCAAAAVLPGVDQLKRPDRFCAISDPRPGSAWGLQYSAIETRACGSFFNSGKFIDGGLTTRYSVLKSFGEAQILHFSCHGVHNFTNFSGIRLMLAGRESLNVDDIFWRGFEPVETQLVVLSACETGLADALKFGDAFTNFPSLLLRAGVRSIIYTMWQVEERASALVFFHFYKYLVNEGLHPARALGKAQKWLRDATGEQLAFASEEMLDCAGDASAPAGLQLWMKRQRSTERRELKPYQHPYYWAAFCHMGT